MSPSSSRKDRARNEGLRPQPRSRNACSDLGDSSRSPRLSRSPAHGLNERGQESHDYEHLIVHGGKGTVIGSNHIHHHYGNEAQRHRTYHQSSSEAQYGAAGLYPPTFPHQFPSVMAGASGSIGSHASDIIWVISPGFRVVQGNVVPLPPEGTISDVVFKFLAPQLRSTQVSVPESGATPIHHSQTPSTRKTRPPSSTRQNPSREKPRRIRKSKKKEVRKKKGESSDKKKGESGDTKAGCEQRT